MSQIYLELLNEDRQDVFQKLADFKNTGYLAGGTALALQIHHRQSFDFDVFVAEKIGNPTTSLSLASAPDIATDKAMTMGRRAVWRDYVDIYTLLHKHHTDMKTIVENAKKKFGNEFIETQFLEQLTYFADITISPIEFIGQVPEVDEIQSFLIQEVSQYLKSK